jgi:hypothetical protein
MEFDSNILFEFLPEEDKKYFQAWVNVFINTKATKTSAVNRIVATYRAPFEKRIIIDLIDYYSMIKQKEREIKLNKIINF